MAHQLLRTLESVPANSVLPPEITDKVIDYLHDQPRALSSCSLVCSDWLPRSRLHRFRDARFTDTSAVAWFCVLLPGAPVIGGYIRTL
ncbi:hypothetical protein BD309DRAFT_823093, partial [Dichomitus squalens]